MVILMEEKIHITNLLLWIGKTGRDTSGTLGHAEHEKKKLTSICDVVKSHNQLQNLYLRVTNLIILYKRNSHLDNF